ncbi:MAG: hypothetical protein H6977_00955 [Gammaproteobacteria bacterium]|nr:hypothetical protein [Gammaproteobacteria bacterium]
MKHLKGAFQGTLAAVALATFAVPSQARITIDALGGELEVEGFLKSEVRSRVGSGPAYLGQWIQRLQVEAALKYENVGIFDELTFVTIARPEYDIVQDMGDLSSNHIGDGTTGPSVQQHGAFNFANDGLGWGGFDFALGDGFTSTGGIGKLVTQGMLSNADAQKMFEVGFRDSRTGQIIQQIPGTGFPQGGGLARTTISGFPQVFQKASNINLDCRRCVDLNVDNIDVAMANTDSNGRLYPFRELYADAVIDDWWIRVGKQQIVWGKTDFFRLQDVINPVDFGQHFFFDSFEDIRIPQWMVSIQYKAGSFGPLTDNAFQVVWNFDEYQQVGLGNPSHFWAHPFAKDTSTFAIFNTYFSPEPCFGPASAQVQGGNAALEDICGSRGPNDGRLPSGFGTPQGLNVNNRPDWDIENTEAGFRWEFRLSDFRFAVSHWYGWNDIPVFKFHTVNLATRHFGQNVAAQDLANVNVNIGDLATARTIYPTGDITTQVRNDLAAGPGNAAAAARIAATAATGGIVDPVLSVTPQRAAQILAGNTGNYQTAAQRAIASGNYMPLWTGIDPSLTNIGCGTSLGGIFCSPVAGGQTSQEYKQAHTLGLAMDYFESWSGVVMRIESSWTFDELVNNTYSPDWVDKSDVMRFSLGFDRPTFIPFLNKDRTFFLSLQIFDTWYWDHEGDKNSGYFVDEHNWITTFFFLGNYMRDKLKPTGFFVWEEATNSFVSGFNLEWLIDNHWSVKGGFHLIWEGDENKTHDTGPFSNFITIDNRTGTPRQYPFVNGSLGPARQGIGGLRNYDELFFELKYQF